MQVDPIKPKLKAPVTERLKLIYDVLLSILLQFAFKFNLRGYNWACITLLFQKMGESGLECAGNPLAPGTTEWAAVDPVPGGVSVNVARRCRLTLSNSR